MAKKINYQDYYYRFDYYEEIQHHPPIKNLLMGFYYHRNLISKQKCAFNYFTFFIILFHSIVS